MKGAKVVVGGGIAVGVITFINIMVRQLRDVSVLLQIPLFCGIG